MDRFNTAEHVAAALTPADPVLCIRPHAAQRAASWFAENFPGQVLYAVKANPDPRLLTAIAAGGVSRFDVASLQEVRSVRAQFPDSDLAYMNPIKSPEAIAEAYAEHGVRIFSLDSEGELDKILRATNNAPDLVLFVRLGVDNSDAKLTLSRKFGVRGPQTIPLLRRTRQAAARLGVCFHVGSQAMKPQAFARAIDVAEDMVRKAGVIPDILDVGGGFPAIYPDLTPAPMKAYVDAIVARSAAFLGGAHVELWCEPGRALVAEASSLIVRVEGQRDFDLYINDGAFGALYDAGHLNWRFPARALDREGMAAPFRFYGPTCDDADYMPGPFFLPAGTGAGDFIEIGQLGAYGRAMAGSFNGYGQYLEAFCNDDPFGTAFAAPADRAHAEGF